MEYNLIQIRSLPETTDFLDDALILTEVKAPLESKEKYETNKITVGKAFNSKNIRLNDAGLLKIDISDPIFDHDEFLELKEALGGEFVMQDDANKSFKLAIEGLLKKVRTLPSIIMAKGPRPPAELGIGLDGLPKYRVEGTIWVDTETFRSYIYFFDRDDVKSDLISRHWIAMADR